MPPVFAGFGDKKTPAHIQRAAAERGNNASGKHLGRNVKRFEQ